MFGGNLVIQEESRWESVFVPEASFYRKNGRYNDRSATFHVHPDSGVFSVDFGFNNSYVICPDTEPGEPVVARRYNSDRTSGGDPDRVRPMEQGEIDKFFEEMSRELGNFEFAPWSPKVGVATKYRRAVKQSVLQKLEEYRTQLAQTV